MRRSITTLCATFSLLAARVAWAQPEAVPAPAPPPPQTNPPAMDAPAPAPGSPPVPPQEQTEPVPGVTRVAPAPPAEPAPSEPSGQPPAGVYREPPAASQPAAPPPAYAEPTLPPEPDANATDGDDRGAYRHDGFYLRVALGLGRMTAKFNSENSRYSSGEIEGTAYGLGGAFDLMIGGTIAPGLVLAGALSTHTADDANADDVTVNGQDVTGGSTVYWKRLNYLYLGPIVDWYVDPRQGFHVQGGLGLAAFSTDSSGTVDNVTVIEKQGAGGFGVMLGVGYEFWLADEWSLGAMVRASYNGVAGQDVDQEIDITDQVWTLPTVLITGTYH